MLAAICRNLLGCSDFAALAREDRRPTQLIIDTDFGGVNGDIDDLGALALAHGLANNGECELLAIVSCIGSKHALQAIDVANTYFGRGAIPLGHKGAAMHDAKPTFAAYLADNFESQSGTFLEARFVAESCDVFVTTTCPWKR